ncbi:MAG TPA: zf-HC2 domain-containing protein [Acidimicrobiia bacterium]|nr:zf-HC2 domain-containing protein [Acidimicrobiia bacterium]
MTHPSELISAYLDGELTDGELVSLMDHLGSCGRCSAELEQMQRVRSAVRSLPVLDMPRGIVPEADPVVVPLRRNKGLWAGVAAAVLIAVIAFAALVTPPPGSLSVDDLNSRFGARASLDPAFGPAKVVVPVQVGGE